MQRDLFKPAKPTNPLINRVDDLYATIPDGVKAVSAKASKHDVRVALDRAEARTLVAGLEQDSVLQLYTDAHASLAEICAALIDITGPAEVVLSTWTLSPDAADRLKELVANKAITRLRVLSDLGVPNYAATAYVIIRDMLEPTDGFRQAPVHAKGLWMRSAEWSVVVSCSANLTGNPRLESYTIMTIPAIYNAAMAMLIEPIWAQRKMGRWKCPTPR
jgi:hypothetical protein